MGEDRIIAPVDAARRDEATLVDRLREGDEASFRALIRDNHGGLLRLARAFVRTEASAEEVVQEAWLAVVAQIDGFDGRSSVRTWIGAIVVNRAKTRGERDRRFVPFSALTPEEEGPVEPERFSARGFWTAPPRPWEAPPEDIVLRKEAVAQVERAMGDLPPAQRTVVELRDVEGWTSEEVCNVLGVSETNQRVLLHRGRQRLRAALERYHAEKK
jgi:RNA polymerase sigma-70 factor (ECF subfamily)